MIFLSIVGGWTGAVAYDRLQKKRIQKKWCEAVSYLANEPLPPNVMQRKLTIYLSSPPADGLLTTREHFHEYVRPILVSAGLDWDAVEGRKEGDVRAGLAERIRKLRKLKGEQTMSPVPEDDLDIIIAEMRGRSGVRDYDGPAGDIIIGRNTWKEYVRGLHEGWLGPLDVPKSAEETDQEASAPQPTQPTQPTQPVADSQQHRIERPHDIASIPIFAAEKVIQHLPHRETQGAEAADSDPLSIISDDASPRAIPESEPKLEEKPKAEDSKDDSKTKKPKQPPPFIAISEYSSSNPASSIPTEFAPSVVIAVPHILGFLNTPIRIYRYLTKRYVADEIGRQVAAACFEASKPYQPLDGSTVHSAFPPEESASPSSVEETQKSPTYEQQLLLLQEEAEWHKSVRKTHDPTKESVWVDQMVLDPRIAERMRKFMLEREAPSSTNHGDSLS